MKDATFAVILFPLIVVRGEANNLRAEDLDEEELDLHADVESMSDIATEPADPVDYLKKASSDILARDGLGDLVNKAQKKIDSSLFGLKKISRTPTKVTRNC
jgi:hypothetical protein